MREPMQLLRFDNTVPHSADVDLWFAAQDGKLAALGKPWFEHMRALGSDIRETMHDGAATVTVGDAALAYVGIYKAHVNVGFFLGAFLDDSSGLLEGSGKRMRHVKLRPGRDVDRDALTALIDTAYRDIVQRIADGAP